jgi:hypothetical protein
MRGRGREGGEGREGGRAGRREGKGQGKERKGTMFSTILLTPYEGVVKQYPILLFGEVNNFLSFFAGYYFGNFNLFWKISGRERGREGERERGRERERERGRAGSRLTDLTRTILDEMPGGNNKMRQIVSLLLHLVQSHRVLPPPYCLVHQVGYLLDTLKGFFELFVVRVVLKKV